MVTILAQQCSIPIWIVSIDLNYPADPIPVKLHEDYEMLYQTQPGKGFLKLLEYVSIFTTHT